MKILDILNKLVWTTLLLLFLWEDLTWRNILIFGGIMITACVVAYAFVRLQKKNENPSAPHETDSSEETPKWIFKFILAILGIGLLIALFTYSISLNTVGAEQGEAAMELVGDFHAPGRYVSGGVVLPQETGHEKGLVLVNVLVDRLGNVVEARVNGASSITDSLVLESAREAAMMTRFTESSMPSERQEALITYSYTRER